MTETNTVSQKPQITIAELRARNGKMSQEKLAEELGVGIASVIRWERDIYSISSPKLVILCKYFGVKSDDLLGITPKNF